MLTADFLVLPSFCRILGAPLLCNKSIHPCLRALWGIYNLPRGPHLRLHLLLPAACSVSRPSADSPKRRDRL